MKAYFDKENKTLFYSFLISPNARKEVYGVHALDGKCKFIKADELVYVMELDKEQETRVRNRKWS